MKLAILAFTAITSTGLMTINNGNSTHDYTKQIVCINAPVHTTTTIIKPAVKRAKPVKPKRHKPTPTTTSTTSTSTTTTTTTIPNPPQPSPTHPTTTTTVTPRTTTTENHHEDEDD